MRKFTVPTRGDVSSNNQAIFDNLKKDWGMIPNLYAYFTKSETALGDYLILNSRKSTLSVIEKELVVIVTSQINGCNYCLSAHTSMAKMNGYSDEQIIEVRKGYASFDSRMDALVKLTASIVNNRGKASQETKDAFFKAGFNEANMVDVVFSINDISINNYLQGLTELEIDFPLAPELV